MPRGIKAPEHGVGYQAKCVGTGCERRHECLRFLAKPSGQAIFYDPPLKRVTQVCAYLWEKGATAAFYLMSITEAEEWAAGARANRDKKREARR